MGIMKPEKDTKFPVDIFFNGVINVLNFGFYKGNFARRIRLTIHSLILLLPLLTLYGSPKRP